MYRVFLKFFPIYSSLKISLITKATFCKIKYVIPYSCYIEKLQYQQPEWPPLYSETFTKQLVLSALGHYFHRSRRTIDLVLIFPTWPCMSYHKLLQSHLFRHFHILSESVAYLSGSLTKPSRTIIYSRSLTFLSHMLTSSMPLGDNS